MSPCGFLPSVSFPTVPSSDTLIFSRQLPDKVKDVLSSLPRVSKSGMAALHTHCRRELFHACWDTLLDNDFVHAYRHGIVSKCADGVFRRVFPCILTYSANYPEKYVPSLNIGVLLTKYLNQGFNCHY
jgi:hypothetical protein